MKVNFSFLTPLLCSTLFSFVLFAQVAFSGDDYSKLNSSGSSLFDSASQWSCVEDHRSGLIWEVKTLLNQFTQYQFSDLSRYVAQVNQSQLCGYSDWRVPAIKELNGLIDNSKLLVWFNQSAHLSIDLNYFPNNQKHYWSSNSSESDQAWYVSFLWGGNQLQSQSKSAHVRLVRGTQAEEFQFSKLDNNGNEVSSAASDWSCVKDSQTGLVWEVKNSGNQNQRYSYAEINAYIAELNRANTCGVTNWQLPTTDQLETLVDYSRLAPAIDVNYFPHVGRFSETLFSLTYQYSAYWSQLEDNSGGIQSSCMDFQWGQSCFRAKSEQLLLRLVAKDTELLKEAPSQAAQETVQKAYLAYYGRPGDPDGVDYWALRLDAAGGSWSQEIINSFGNSDEFSTRFGNLSNTQLITNIYQQLFNRNPEQAGLDYFISQLETGQASLAQIAVVILNGAQGDDSISLSNKLAACDYFTEKVRSGMSYGEIDTARNIISSVGSESGSLNQSYATIDSLSNP